MRRDTNKLKPIIPNKGFYRKTLNFAHAPVARKRTRKSNKIVFTLEHYAIIALISSIAGLILAGSIFGNIFLIGQ